jgi:serine-type D-Ala-D-Ala carboxypeptidase/endopeptidase (penicillin-binding protein 4)
LSIHNMATTTAGPTSLFVRPVFRTSTLEVRGNVDTSTTRIVRNVAVPNPTLYFVNAAREGLIRNGVMIRGDGVEAPALDVERDPAARMVAEIRSDRLPQIAATMMKMSQNLFAETLLRSLGAAVSGRGSADAGCAAVRDILGAWGVAAGDAIVVDGSGLSRYNLITADALVAILQHVYRDVRLREPFLEALPAAGVDGTLEERMKGTPAFGKARAKTGSFSNARALAGFVQTADGERLAFAVLANNYGVAPAVIDNATDAIVVALSQFSRAH